MKKMAFNQRIRIENIEILKEYLEGKVLEDAIDTFKVKLEESKEKDTGEKFYMVLVGSEYNYNWLKSNANSSQDKYDNAVKSLNELRKENKISQKDYDEKAEEIISLHGQSTRDISDNLKRYEYYFDEYGTYDIVMFRMEDNL